MLPVILVTGDIGIVLAFKCMYVYRLPVDCIILTLNGKDY